jgi:hypothetical protein
MKTFALRMNNAASVLRRILGAALYAQPWAVVAVVLILLFGPSRASADIINTYVIAPGASTLLDGYIESITGGFTFDDTDDAESAVSLTRSGMAPFSGAYTSAAYGPYAVLTVAFNGQIYGANNELPEPYLGGAFG